MRDLINPPPGHAPADIAAALEQARAQLSSLDAEVDSMECTTEPPATDTGDPITDNADFICVPDIPTTPWPETNYENYEE